MWFRSVDQERATKVAPATGVSAMGLTGSSKAPHGEVLLTRPQSLVGDYCPLVRP